jgi:hypothetical protein
MKGPFGFQGRPPGLLARPGRSAYLMQRFMFPMGEFRPHFPFVTLQVTCQVECAVMFPEYVAMTRLPAADHP